MKSKKKVDGVDVSLMRNGGLSYMEIPAKDVQKSALFYRKVFGWKVGIEGVEFARFMDPQELLLGRFVRRLKASKPGLLPYFYVKDIRSVVRKAKTGGGKIVKPVSPEGNLFVAQIVDPGGNVLGLWQLAK